MQLGRMFNAVKLAPEMNELFTIAIEYHVSCNFAAGVYRAQGESSCLRTMAYRPCASIA